MTDEISDPLAGVHLFDPPAGEDELRLRQHMRIFAETASDHTISRQERENAVRHILECDPARGIGELLTLLEEAYSVIDTMH